VIYFTSDLHLNHANIIKYNNRPFVNVVEMNKQLITNINSVVKSNDELYILGDFAFAQKRQTNEYLDDIQCKNVFLIKGNHDSFLKDRDTVELNFKGIYQYYELNYNGISFILFHYPIAVWNKKHFGSIHLYGHVHTYEGGRKIPTELLYNSWNVNCEFWNYKPMPITYFVINRDLEANSIK